MNCQEFVKDREGNLVPCQGKPLRAITFRGFTDCTSGSFCARHAIALRRKESRGELEILADEPAVIPFDGEQVVYEERTVKEFYGV